MESQWKDDVRGNVQVLAVKVPRGAGIHADFARLTQRVIQEGRVWSTATHPNITPFLGFSFDFDRPGLPCLVSPYYGHGNITSYLKKYPHINKLPLIMQVTGALSYLHDMSIIHGDIKASNILINDEGQASLTDFGLSTVLQASGFTPRAVPGTRSFIAPDLVKTKAVRWQAPELFESGMEPGKGYIQRVTQATDVWAFSMTVIEILTGSIPFSGIRNDAKVVIAIMTGDRPKRQDCPPVRPDIWNMLERCWTADPKQRPLMATVFHFFASQTTQDVWL